MTDRAVPREADEPLLACDGARIDAVGGVLIEALSAAGVGRHVGLVGSWSPLFALLGVEARLCSGSVEVDGVDASRATALGVVGLARYEPCLPRAWSAARYLTESARLLGLSPRRSRRAAHDALDALGLVALGPRALGRLDQVERRALLIVHTTLGAPRVIALETPLAGLDEAAQSRLVPLIDRASSGRRLLWSVAAVAPTGAGRGLLDRMDSVLVLEAGRLVAGGPPGQALSPGHRYVVTVARGAEELASRLTARGLSVQTAESAARPEAAITGPGARLVVDLGTDMTPNDLLSAALELEIAVLELVPLATTPVPEVP